jgi:LVIVD repeat
VRRPVTALLAALVAVLFLIPPGSAGAHGAPPAGAISKNVQFVSNIPEIRGAISINFIGTTMFVSTVHGLYSYDVSNPAAPTLLGALPMYIWENEDMDVDPVHHRVFISRDPRGFTTPATPGSAFPYGAVHIIDVSDPTNLRQLNVFLVPAGHTTTCVDACNYIWTAGPYANAQTQPQFVGRPIFATDVRDPMNPKPCPHPIDTGHNDGVTDYVHDVQVDAAGVAWVSGQGGVRGYWTSGRHPDPVTGKVREATGCSPIPYAGGGSPSSATPTRFMHNSWRDVHASIPGEADSRGKVLYATEENVTTDCKSAGRFATYDLRGSFDGQGWRDIKKTHFRMRVLDTWTPRNQGGSNGCASAHYFSDRGDGLLAYAFYTQGTRFLDVSDPRHIREVGYYRPDDANTWAAYWHDGYVYVADLQRGVDVLKFTGSIGGRGIAAPAGGAVQTLTFSRTFAYLCPIHAPLAAAKP